MGDGQRPRGAQEEDEYNLLCPTIQSVDSNLPPNPLHLPGVPERGQPDVDPLSRPCWHRTPPSQLGMVNEMISSSQGGAPSLFTRCSTSFWVWARAFPYAPSPQSCAEETGGVRLPLFFWLDWQHIRGASCVRCPPQFVPSTGGGGFLRFPHAWDDPRLGACAHERAVTYLRMPRLLCPLASRTQPSGAPPVRTPQGPTTEGGHASC
jgi:hypothetical protein